VVHPFFRFITPSQPAKWAQNMNIFLNLTQKCSHKTINVDIAGPDMVLKKAFD
jgi:hypothetical protein